MRPPPPTIPTREHVTLPPAAQFLVFLVALVGLWFVITRPTRREQRRIATLQTDVQVGDEVILSAGIFGTVHSIDGERVGIEIAEGTVIMVARQVVVRRVSEDVSGDPAEPGTDAEEPLTDEHHPED
ncbi:MAG: yajC [Marmoricola sp.]|nr:yajC [Marmoricola sp.]